MKSKTIALAAVLALVTGCSGTSESASALTDPPQVNDAQLHAYRQQLEVLANELAAEDLPGDVREVVNQAKTVRYTHDRGYELHIAFLQEVMVRKETLKAAR